MNPNKEKANRILIFDLYETLVENVRMYKNVGFNIVDENDEEFIMVCEL